MQVTLRHRERGGWAPLLSVLLALGPVICGVAEVANEFWDDRLDRVRRRRDAYGVNSSGGLGVGRRLQRNHITIAVVGLSAVGLALAWAEGGTIGVGLVAAGIALGLAYSVPGIRFKNHPIVGPLARVFGYGWLAYGIGYVFKAGSLSGVDPIFPVLGGLLCFGFSTSADLADAEADRKNGLRTLPVVFGRRASSRAIAGGLVIAAIGAGLLVSAARGSPPLRLAGVILFLPVWAEAFNVLRNSENPRALARLHVRGLVWQSLFLPTLSLLTT